MAKDKPESKSIGNTNDAARGRAKGGKHVDPRINSEVKLADVKAGKIAKAK